MSQDRSGRLVRRVLVEVSLAVARVVDVGLVDVDLHPLPEAAWGQQRIERGLDVVAHGLANGTINARDDLGNVGLHVVAA